jgi:hypothetical protein
MKVRSWYGLTGEIEVENELWHLVRIGNVALNHPPVVNLILRRGLPRRDRLRLSYLHEFGHFQTLPLALLHLLLLLGSALGKHRSLSRWLAWLAALILAHEAVWEMAAEAYVVVHDGKAYFATYRKTPNPLLLAFWAGMSGLGIGLSWRLLRNNARLLPALLR